MGLRHRSIRLRVGILIVVPVLCLIGLYAFAASITLGSALTQAHTKTLRNDLLTPVSNFQAALAQERHLALLSLASPSSTQFAAEVGMQENTTRKALDALTAATQAQAIADNATAAEQHAIKNLLAAAATLPALRGNVAANAIGTTTALADYDAIINSGYNVIDAASGAQTSVPIVTQALNVISLARGLQATLAESDLLAADMTQRKFPEADKVVFAQLASIRQQLTTNAAAELLPAYRALVDKNVSPGTAAALTTAEARVVATTWHKGPPPLAIVASTAAFAPYAKGLSAALTEAGSKLQNQTSHQANVVFVELLLAAGLGLLGTIASIALSLIIGRGLVRQLRDLRESALTLAHDKLPSVITQLRAGEQVDPSEYEPGDAAGGNEIQQVQHAFNIVQQTAVKTAIDEARLRRGISDVFRNLAGRSQSLLHRQLTLLDGMERRATEPDELEDLFRIDHLTTRMRRHAEGLIILSGETPARGWRQPVPLVDVLRAAVAEVEDYTRIRVLCRTNAAVAGHAVADVIHLVAELAENATVFSPPNTPVRIQGDIVGRGFAVEIEDRGLGISPARMDEINANLANPPQFDLSGSDRLGLFIAGQLALRHEIKITLRPSVYGGTTAIVLIPTGLVVEEDSYERDPALPAGQSDDSGLPDRIAGRHSALPQPGARLARAPNGSSLAITQALGEADADLDRSELIVGSEASAASAGAVASQSPGPATFVATEHGDVTGVVEPEPVRLSWSDETVRISEHEPVRLSWSSEQSSPSVSPTPAEAASERGSANVTWSDESAAAGATEPVKLSWSEVSSNPAEREPDLPGRSEGGSNGRQQASATGWPTAEYGFAESPGSVGSHAAPAGAGSAGSSDGAVSKTDVSELGLPVRVRQASLAPQLRKPPSSPPADTSLGAGFYSGATGAPGTARRPGDSDIDPFAPRRSAARATSDSGSHLASPEAARSTMSALQRGWQLGRSEAEHGTSPGQPSSGYSPSGYPPDDSGPYQIPPTSATPGSARGSNPAGTGATDPDPNDSADQHDNE
jgi:signal transduction histidine kinase